MARGLLSLARMFKPLLILAVLVSPALADDKTTKLGLTLTSGKDQRHYTLQLAADACGEISSQGPEASDEVKICQKPDGNTDLRLEIEWQTHHDGHYVKNRSTVVAARGKSFELDGGSAKLNVSVQ